MPRAEGYRRDGYRALDLLRAERAGRITDSAPSPRP